MSKYFITNTQGRYNVSEVINIGLNEIAGSKFKGFPKSQCIENYTWFKQINGGNLNYSVNGVDVANNFNCGANAPDDFAAGTYTVTVPNWATQIAFVLVGAGGGGGTGGRGANLNNGSGGAGGGSGAVLISNAIPLSSSSNRTLSLTVGAGGLGGVRALINNLPNSGVYTGIGTNGGTGGNTTININGVLYRAGGGVGGGNGYNISADPNPTVANGGNRGIYNAAVNMQTAAYGVSAADGVLDSYGSPGTAGGGGDVNPTLDYYLPISRTGGAGGAKGSDGKNPGLNGDGYGAGGGGGGGSTASGGDFGGEGGDGLDGTARLVYYP